MSASLPPILHKKRRTQTSPLGRLSAAPSAFAPSPWSGRGNSKTASLWARLTDHGKTAVGRARIEPVFIPIAAESRRQERRFACHCIPLSTNASLTFPHSRESRRCLSVTHHSRHDFVGAAFFCAIFRTLAFLPIPSTWLGQPR